MQKHVSVRAAIPRNWSVLIYGTGALLFALNMYRYGGFWHDDAYITLRYALNIVAHGEASWNLGDMVEGYTEPLHLLLLSGLMAVGLPPVIAGKMLGWASALALGLATYRAAKKLTANKDIIAMAVVIVAAAPSLHIWANGGLGAPLTAALVAFSTLAILPFITNEDARLNPALWGGFFAGLAYLARPDSVTFFAGLLPALLFLGAGRLSQRFKACMIFGLIMSAIVGLHILWRLSYYGEFMPNTFFAKVGLSLKHRLSIAPFYFWHNALPALPVLGLAFIGFLASLRPGEQSVVTPNRHLIWIMTSGIGVACAYILYAGGDHMRGARMMLPFFFPAILILITALAALKPQTLRRALAACLLGLMSILVTQSRLKEDPASYVGTEIGKYIAEHWPTGSVIGLHTAGSTPFYAHDNVFIDMLGLNDATIAKRADIPFVAPFQWMPGHAKGDAAYVMARQPDYIIAGPAEGTDVAEPWFLTDYELSTNDTFQACYVKKTVTIDKPVHVTRPVQTLTYYQRTC